MLVRYPSTCCCSSVPLIVFLFRQVMFMVENIPASKIIVKIDAMLVIGQLIISDFLFTTFVMFCSSKCDDCVPGKDK